MSSSRIVGGSDVSSHSIPYQVALTDYRDKGVPYCGGALISPNYVLTSAQCTKGKTAGTILVVVGEHNYQLIGDGEDYYDVEAITTHPSYNPADSHTNDLALLRLSYPVSISSNAGFIF
jgi:secreted trypsin-like serine protease